MVEIQVPAFNAPYFNLLEQMFLEDKVESGVDKALENLERRLKTLWIPTLERLSKAQRGIEGLAKALRELDHALGLASACFPKSGLVLEYEIYQHPLTRLKGHVDEEMLEAVLLDHKTAFFISQRSYRRDMKEHLWKGDRLTRHVFTPLGAQYTPGKPVGPLQIRR